MNTATAQSTSAQPRRVLARRRISRTAAWAAAALMLVVGIVGAIAPSEALADHTHGAGAVSEVATGLAFVAGALALAMLRPAGGWRGALWALAPIGLTAAGATMVTVPMFGAEPPFWLFVLGASLALVGTVAAGILGISQRVWPWWTGVALALLLPILFGAPFNGFFLAGVWVCVALTARTSVRVQRI